ncbi:hypothetical protein B0H10DRAFT_330143 [Mycena sp. CBHHK59/15]|nr:hypothetical protein B0H10DRAFT_330143 [Mycena sp. CBHHK59/15]
MSGCQWASASDPPGELGMSMVVQYLRDIKWNAPDMNLEGATNKLERVVKEMEILCGIDRSAAVKAGKSTSRKQKGKDRAQKTSNSAAAASKDAAKEIMYDNVFTRVMAGRQSNNNYRPRKPNANLSEEEEDDFVDVVADATASTSNGPQKRKVIVVDGVAQPPPPRRSVSRRRNPLRDLRRLYRTSMSSKLMTSRRTKSEPAVSAAQRARVATIFGHPS